MFRRDNSEKFNLVLGIIIISVIIFLLAIGPYFGLQAIVIFGLLPGLFVIALLYYFKNFIPLQFEFICYSLIVLFSLIAVFLDINQELFAISFRRLLAALMGAFIPLAFVRKKDSFDIYFHLGFIFSILFLILFEYLSGNFVLSGFEKLKGSRDRFSFNANYYSYISYFANFSLLYLRLKFKNTITLISLIILPLLFIILSFITQSRSGIVFILLINGVFWFYIEKDKKTSILKKISKNIVLGIISIFLIFKFIGIYNNSLIKNRVSDNGDESRSVLVKEGIDVFMNNPLTGVGLGQFPRYSIYGQFTHNSFVEVLAEQGIFFFILLVIFFFRPIVKILNKHKLLLKENSFKIHLLFFTTFILYNNAYVFYKFSFSMMYFFLICGIMEREVNKIKK